MTIRADLIDVTWLFPLSLPITEHIQFCWVKSVFLISFPAESLIPQARAGSQMSAEPNLQNSVPPLRLSFLGHPQCQKLEGPVIANPSDQISPPSLSWVPAEINMFSLRSPPPMVFLVQHPPAPPPSSGSSWSRRPKCLFALNRAGLQACHSS